MTQIIIAILGALGSLIGGAFGAGVAAHLALNHYYPQRIWDRRADAYTSIFEALGGMQNWYRCSVDDMLNDATITVEEENIRSESYRQARQKLFSRISRETWLIPDEMREIINEMERTIDSIPSHNWNDMLWHGIGVIGDVISKLRTLARYDLKVSKNTHFQRL